jgi:hypothetical protein
MNKIRELHTKDPIHMLNYCEFLLDLPQSQFSALYEIYGSGKLSIIMVSNNKFIYKNSARFIFAIKIYTTTAQCKTAPNHPYD